MQSESDRSAATVHRLRVEGVEAQRTALPTQPRPFDETYEIEAEHPAEALEKLLREVEWGILDAWAGFTVTVAPSEEDDDAAE